MATLRNFKPACREFFRFSLLAVCIFSLGCNVGNTGTATPPASPPPSTPPPSTPPPSNPPPSNPPPSNPPPPAVTSQIKGSVHEGQQPIVGASVQLYAAGTTGYGTGAVSLLSTPALTDASGNFTAATAAACPSSTSQLYLVATGGSTNPSASANNASLALMGAIGLCTLNNTAGTVLPSVNINEATTVAAVYSLAGFMDPATYMIGASATNAIGIANAFQTAANLADITTGQSLATTPSGDGAIPNAEINTLADVIAPCVNSTGSGTSCMALFTAATPSGSTAPTNTLQALFNIATHPVSQVSALFALAQPTAPFQPALSAAPNDWTVALHYTGGGLAAPIAVSIDSLGDAWIANDNNSILELSTNGAFLSGSAGFTGGGINGPRGLAIDLSDNVWVANFLGNSVTKLSNSGAVLSGPNGFTNGISGVNGPTFVAIDGTGDAWVTNSSSPASTITKLANDGTLIADSISPCLSAASCQFADAFQIALDGTGNIWAVNNNPGPAAVAKLSSSGAVLSGQTGFTSGVSAASFIAFDHAGNAWVTNYTSDGVSNMVTKLDSNGNLIGSVNAARLYDASGVAIDGIGNAWVVGESASLATLSELDNNQNLLSGSTGYIDAAPPALLPGCTVTPTNDCTLPRSSKAVAIDGSGNAWVSNLDGSISEFVGIAAPVVTPLSVGIKSNTLGTRP